MRISAFSFRLHPSYRLSITHSSPSIRSFSASSDRLLKMSFNNNLKRKADATSTNDAKKPKANASITSFFGAPKTTTSSTKAAVSSGATVPVSAGTVTTKFDKAAWVAKLTAEQRELLQLEINTLHESWLAHLKEEIVSREFLELKRFLKKEWESGKTIFPPKEEIYSWYDLRIIPSLPSLRSLEANTNSYGVRVGLTTLLFQASKPSSSVRIPTITTTKLTASASVFALPQGHHHRSRTSTKVSSATIRTSALLHLPTQVFSLLGQIVASYS